MIHVTNRPYSFYGAFSDYTTQTIGSASIAYVMQIGQTDEAQGVSIVSGSSIRVANSGKYNIQWSGQFQNVNNTAQDINVWLRKNGVDVVGSTGEIGIIGQRGPSQPGHMVAGWNYVMTLTGGDYLNLVWNATSTDVTLVTSASATSPIRPSTAGLIVTITQV